jgi:hypothetical protein
MNPIWLTVVVALISPLGALGAQQVAAVRAYRLAETERDARRDDQAHQNREEAYAKVLAAARMMKTTVRGMSAPAGDQPPRVVLHDAAAHVELHAPDLADGPLVAVLDAADRMASLALNERSTAAVVKEAEQEFDVAVQTLRAGMRDDLGTGRTVIPEVNGTRRERRRLRGR